MNLQKLREFIDSTWERSILPALIDYVRIPCKSPLFEPDWAARGHMQRAARLMADWSRTLQLRGAHIEVRELPGRTPLLLVDVPGEIDDSVLLYGHMDKQPEFTGWLPGLGPWEPVLRDGRLYGRGSADDGYALFSSLAAIAALRAQGIALPRCVVLIEASEESGSIDLPAHLEALGNALGSPSLVVCLDAESGNYGQLWCTTSLRGNLVGTLRVRVLSEGVHSGMATGIAPSPFRIVQSLLARLEDPSSGEAMLGELRVTIPPDRRTQIEAAAAVLGSSVAGKLPWVHGARAVTDDPAELLANNTWRATVAITGAEGLPTLASAGNVLLPELAFKLSLRLPPTCDASRAAAAVKRALETGPPYGAQVSFETAAATAGWNAPPFAPWLDAAIQAASQEIFGRAAVHVGCGGTIPFMAMLGERFPQTQFLITGVLGPHANAHGPNEFLHLEYARQITACTAAVLAAHAARHGRDEAAVSAGGGRAGSG
ncbi:MAG: M20/M25/M40 family metallo-hydrolase [Gammaproteobacteria bacterium]|nr:M20/M25/M40 family metallo-hydrolase [Gammaproteobacteria bacterium]